MRTTASCRSATSYLALSLLSGLLETGVATNLFRDDRLVIGLAAALAYQVGCLARNPLRMAPPASVATGLVGIACAAMATVQGWLILLAVALVSAAIQSTRDVVIPHPAPSVVVKRASRVGGFMAGIALGWIGRPVWLMVVTGCCAVGVALYSVTVCGGKVVKESKRNWRAGSTGWIMVFHQIHYFAYSYVLIYQLLRSPVSYIAGFRWNAPLHAAIWFGIGWVTYIEAEQILRRGLNLQPRTAALVGHAWVILCLAGMALTNSVPWGLSAFWALGGLGGGSVYSIKELTKALHTATDLELWEHVGHVLGAALSVLACSVFPNPVVLSCLLASVAASEVIRRVLGLSVFASASSTEDFNNNGEHGGSRVWETHNRCGLTNQHTRSLMNRTIERAVDGHQAISGGTSNQHASEGFLALEVPSDVTTPRSRMQVVGKATVPRLRRGTFRC